MSSAAWHPGIDAVCRHWADAPMLQQTYQALANAIEQENDACIDCAKAIIEAVAQIIVTELDSPTLSATPKEQSPSFGTWVSAAVRVLKLGDVRNDRFRKLVSAHHKLTEALGALRNEAGPVSHGKEAFLLRLSTHHRHAAVLSADAIVAFLHQSYMDAELDLQKTREPFERFETLNDIIDDAVILNAEVDEEGNLAVTVNLPGGESIPITTSPSRFLFQIDRDAYIEALLAARTALATPAQSEETLG